MTLKQIRDIVKAELNLDGHPDYPDVRLTLYVNHAQREIQKNLIGLGIKRWITRQNINSISFSYLGMAVRKITKGSVQASVGLGTISSSTSSTSVTGTSTKFLNSVNVGDSLYRIATGIYTLIGTVASITSDTALTLSANGAITTSDVSWGSTINNLNGIVTSVNGIVNIELYSVDKDLWGTVRDVDYENFNETITNLFLRPTWKQAIFCKIGDDYFLYPNGVYLLTAYYNKVITDLSADADLTEIPIEFERYLVDRTKLFVTGGDSNNIDAQIQNEYSKYKAKEAARADVELQPKAVLQ